MSRATCKSCTHYIDGRVEEKAWITHVPTYKRNRWGKEIMTMEHHHHVEAEHFGDVCTRYPDWSLLDGNAGEHFCGEYKRRKKGADNE